MFSRLKSGSVKEIVDSEGERIGDEIDGQVIDLNSGILFE